jgi:hypothetical protein
MFKNEIIWVFLLPVIKQFWYAGEIGGGGGTAFQKIKLSF